MQGDNVLKFIQSVVNGVPAVLIFDEDILKLASPFQFTLVGKFTLHRPNLDSIRSFFANLKQSGFYSVGFLDSHHVAIQLLNDLDYSRVFARRAYFISNCQMRILKWTPFFDVQEESPIVPIWISFLNLRLHFLTLKSCMLLDLFLGGLCKPTKRLPPGPVRLWLGLWWKLIFLKNMQKKFGCHPRFSVIYKKWNLRKFLNFVLIVTCMVMRYLIVSTCILSQKKLLSLP
ncbi:hypothetical protein MA16_Dca009273 [Dendrobium catenatum]|uniref:DUF4283 domain-containing protein n=1 Tax=Dendrobium catenatum TaxID=906689 RepID=A0A2I0WYX2_9ASPA|nr:hypothetical protein MA16_Dca009273 [Dendrobium catenatum]